METLTSLELQWTGRIKILKFAAAVNVIFSFWFCWLAAGSGLTSEQDEVSWSFSLVLSQYGLSLIIWVYKADLKPIKNRKKAAL